MQKNINNYRVNSSDFEIDEERKDSKGGTFGVVTFQTQKKTNLKCAVKKTKNPLSDDESKHTFNREIQIFATHHHPAIVKFIGYTIGKDDFGYIYLEEAENGSIASYLDGIRQKPPTAKPLSVTNKYILSYGIALAMQYLHQNKCVHRDLKVENVLLDDKLRPLVTDFGISKSLSEINLSSSMSAKLQGAPKIFAPELIEDVDKYKDTLPIDVYSYAVTLFEIWSEQKIYTGMNQYKLFTYISGGNRAEIPKNVPKIWKELITECWSQDPENRPTFDDIVEVIQSDKFKKDVDKKEVAQYEEYIRNNARQTNLIDLRNKALKKSNLNDIFTYIILLSTEKNGFKEPETIVEIYNFAKIYLDEVYADQNKMTNKEWLKKTAFVELSIGKACAALGNFKNCESHLRQSITHGRPLAAYYLAELMFSKKIEQKFDNEMIQIYEYAANKGISEAKKKLATLKK